MPQTRPPGTAVRAPNQPASNIVHRPSAYRPKKSTAYPRCHPGGSVVGDDHRTEVLGWRRVDRRPPPAVPSREVARIVACRLAWLGLGADPHRPVGPGGLQAFVVGQAWPWDCRPCAVRRVVGHSRVPGQPHGSLPSGAHVLAAVDAGGHDDSPIIGLSDQALLRWHPHRAVGRQHRRAVPGRCKASAMPGFPVVTELLGIADAQRPDLLLGQRHQCARDARARSCQT